MPDTIIHQIYFRPDQRPGLEKGFVPYDNSGSARPDLYEFFVFRQEYLAGRIPDVGYRGYVSWKFKSKTHVSGSRFLDFIHDNPGYDVYFIHPFPIDLAMGNVWDQGEHYHPRLKHLANHIFSETGYSISTEDVPTNLRISAACNYWAGNKKFWDAYMAFCLPLYEYVTQDLSGPEKKLFFSRADRHAKSSYFAYLFERLFTTFLNQNTEIKALAYRYSEAELAQKYTPHEATLVSRLQQVEDEHPDAAEPLKTDRLLAAGLHYYYLHKFETQFRKSAYIFTKLVWNHMPGKGRLLRLPLISRLRRYVSTKLSVSAAAGDRVLKP